MHAVLVRWSYDAREEGDLSVEEGQKLVLVQHVSNDWSLVRNGAEEGLIPRSYIHESSMDSSSVNGIEEELVANSHLHETRMSHNNYAVEEVVLSEESYRGFMCILWYKFLPQLRARHPQELAQSNFNEIGDILELSQQLIKNARYFVNNGVPRHFGDVFNSLLSQFEVYIGFAGNYCKIVKAIDELNRRSTSFKAMCLEFQNKYNGLSLLSLLIMPIQRIPRYILLLKEIQKKTAGGELASLLGALSGLKRIACKIDQHIGKVESDIKLISVGKEIFPRTLWASFGRRFIRSGLLTVHKRNGVNEWMFFLFSDYLIYAKILRIRLHGVKYLYKGKIGVACVREDCSRENGFRVNGTKTLYLSTNSDMGRQGWMTDLNLNSNPTHSVTHRSPAFSVTFTATFNSENAPKLHLKFTFAKVGLLEFVNRSLRTLSAMELDVEILGIEDRNDEFSLVSFSYGPKEFIRSSISDCVKSGKSIQCPPFVIGFFTCLRIRLSSTVEYEGACADICLQDIINFSGVDTSSVKPATRNHKGIAYPKSIELSELPLLKPDPSRVSQEIGKENLRRLRNRKLPQAPASA